MQNLTKILLFLAACGFTAGCDEFGWNPLDPESPDTFSANRTVVPAPPVLLQMDLPTLNDSASFYDERRDLEQALLIRRRTWRGPPGNAVEASMIEIRHLEYVPIGAAPTPSDAVIYWERLKIRNLDFQVLYESRNAVGPVLWRRFVMGPQVCVLFTQGVAPESEAITRHLLGYYCAAPGEPFTDGQAETVVRAVRVQEGDPELTPDG